MTQFSLRATAGKCGVHAPLSVLRDVMVYGGHRTTSVAAVLAQMEQDCIAQPEAQAALIEIGGAGTITSAVPALPGLSLGITLDLTVTNLTQQSVNIQEARLLMVSSGGSVLGMAGLFVPGAMFEDAVVPLPLGSTQADSLVLTSGTPLSGDTNPFSFVVSIHAVAADGTRQHLLRRVPIRRAGFAEPENIATPSPVFVGLWNRPVEVFPAFHDGAPVQWLQLAGDVINLARSTVQVTIDNLRVRLFSELSDTPDLDINPPKWFFNRDGTLVPPNPDGRVPLKGAFAGFVAGVPVTMTGVRPTLRVDLLYTLTEGGKTTQGQAGMVVPVAEMSPAILAPPLKSPATGLWQWGNAPDHVTFTDQSGSPTGTDSHGNIGERYCYDILMVQQPGGPTFAGTCVANPDGTHSGSCTLNVEFYAYKQPVFAAKAGKVVLVQDGMPEHFGFNRNPAVGVGNFVMIDHGDGSFAGYFHLVPGSVLVSLAPGMNSVAVGQQIGQVGNSNGSSEPHLHFGYSVVHPTGRATGGAVAFKGLTAMDGTPVTAIPGFGWYKS
ncbi:M23 family metallopeptidase [Phenylobacterium sp.]|uniref:M23 family metallopeptidase n=1 Tax=Phenylobacterium sp. TaxID=1871053 RepID=UPI0025E7FEDB|nr:M23 family metallopeptidase [Phenylobacterium sp.]